MALENLMRTRKSTGDKVELIKKIVERNSQAALSQGQVESYIEDLNKLEAKLEATMEKIFAEVDETNLPSHEKEYLKIFLNIAETKGALRNLKEVPQEPKQRINPIHRPALELPKFSGDRDEWASFYSIFKSAIEDDESLTNAERLQYLLRCLSGPPKDSIKNFPLVNASFVPALKLLTDNYSNKRMLVHENIKKFLNLPVLSVESAPALQKMIDSTYQGLSVLRNEGEPTDQWGTLITHILIEKLDPKTREVFECQQSATEVPTYNNIIEFLKKRVGSLRMLSSTSPKPKPVAKPGEKSGGSAKKVSSNISVTASKCIGCDSEDHILWKCPKFAAMTIPDRKGLAQRKQLCFNCLRPGHGVATCESSDCRKCHKKHHTLLHAEKETPSSSTEETPEPVSKETSVSSHHSSIKGQVLLSTAIVKIQDKFGTYHHVRALLDQGSQATFITEDCVRRLKLPRTHSSVQVNGIGSAACSGTRGLVKFQINSHVEKSFQIEVQALILPSVTGLLPTRSCSPQVWEHIKRLPLADPQWFKSAPVDLLIGSDLYYQIIQSTIIQSVNSSPTAQLTHLGWVLGGPVCEESNVVTSHLVQVEVQDLLQKFWELEEIPSNAKASQEEELAESHFKETVTREEDGRYVLKLPFKPNAPKLSDTRELAMKRLLSMEKRFVNNPALYSQYKSFMQDYEILGHMVEILPEELSVKSSKRFYFPHHGVIRQDSTTTKLRVVFDGSAKTKFGCSLNETLLVGPKIQEDLLPILIRFRIHLVALKADIEKMYRQVKISKEDQSYQLILWRETPDLPVKCFMLTTVTYGTASAPFHAIRTVKQLAMDEKERFPQECEVIARDFYVDDLMSGASNTDEATQLQSNLVDLMNQGKFPLKKWSSNDPAVLDSIPAADRETSDSLTLDEDTVIKTLGLQWHPKIDSFSFKYVVPSNNVVLTKRCLLSEMSRIFDPLGWLAPVTIKFKIIFQQLWVLQLGWDDSLPTEIEDSWASIKSELPSIERISIPRCILQPEIKITELHGFCDASEKAYGATTYLRSIDVTGHIQVRLICSKTRVAPTKKVTLPRLELCGALLLSKLIHLIKTSLPIQIDQIHGWCDATIVLHWIRAQPSRWQTFVANRVSQIQGLLPSSQWHHVAGKENPADCCSRGILPSELASHPLWWSGPNWLSSLEINYGCCPDEELDPKSLEEKPNKIKSLIVSSPEEFTLLQKFSSLTKLKRVTALCLRFAYNCRNKSQRIYSPLSPKDLDAALMDLVRHVQLQEFQHEVEALSLGIPVHKKSRIRSLNPFIDSVGILRVGGRISLGPFPENKKHPALLPTKHSLTEKIIMAYHYKLFHGGPTLTLSSIQEEFWIPRGRKTVAALISKCVKCFRFKCTPQLQVMGNLPENRLQGFSTFRTVGLDYAGPISVRDRAGRGTKCTKNYIAVFVCFTTHAVHLELVEDLTTEACLAAIKAFISRRGKPEEIRSDNGTNLTGASNEMKKFLEVVSSSEHNRKLSSSLANDGIKWTFNPPSSPHFGGLWEAAVKSAKYHLVRMVQGSSLTRSQHHVLLTQVEAILNSRPICPLATDPGDFAALTPGHFLIGRALTSFPEPDLTNIKEGRLSHWQRVQQLTQQFWNRWSKEVIATMQQRTKWRSPQDNIQIGSLFLLREENLPPLKWKLGRIIKVHPGADGYTRVVTVKTATGEFKRPIVKICVLPIDI